MIPNQLYALLQERGIDPAAQPVTLMRHKDKRFLLHKYLGTKALSLYQAKQPLRHEPGGLIVGFYGHKSEHAILLGVWRVIAVMPASDAYHLGLFDGGFEQVAEGASGFYHELQEMDFLSDLRLKLEIRWGKSAISWRRVLKPTDDYAVSIRSEVGIPFEGAKNASLVMAELRIALHDALWQQGLGAIAGVYLITDEHSGRHYVGSASGGNGIWQRWSDYACTGHGGNLELVDLLRESPGRENELRFTLLEEMPLPTPRAQVLARESFWKVALGSRKFGLNSN